jgi:hypothetical protein
MATSVRFHWTFDGVSSQDGDLAGKEILGASQPRHENKMRRSGCHAHPLLRKAIDQADVQRIYILSPATLLQADAARFAESIKTSSM